MGRQSSGFQAILYQISTVVISHYTKLTILDMTQSLLVQCLRGGARSYTSIIAQDLRRDTTNTLELGCSDEGVGLAVSDEGR